MTDILVLLDHPTTTAALVMARRWCKGRQIGHADALTHALEVVDTLHQHIDDVAPEVVAAALLHDSPDLAPPAIDIDATLAELSPEVARLVGALHDEHAQLDTGTAPAPSVDDLGLLQVSAADKIVSLGAVVFHPDAASDPAGYWSQRRDFTATLGYLRDFHHTAEQVLPPSMTAELGHLVGLAEDRTLCHGDR